MKHIIPFSGGHSSAIVAIAIAERFGKENTILVNHNISFKYEDKDIKRFKKEVSEYIGIPITYANYEGIKDPNKIPSQFDISLNKKGFKIPGVNDGFCTSALKTEPFYKYIEENHNRGEFTVYYGYDDTLLELNRIYKKINHFREIGYLVDAPLGLWGNKKEGMFSQQRGEIYNRHVLHKEYMKFKKISDASFDYFCSNVDKSILPLVEVDKYEIKIRNTEEIGIKRPGVYKYKKHANCWLCLKSGIHSFYVDWGIKPELFKEAIQCENDLGHSILSDQAGGSKSKLFLKDLIPIFKDLKEIGIPFTEHSHKSEFKQYFKILKEKHLNKLEVKEEYFVSKPCTCTI